MKKTKLFISVLVVFVLLLLASGVSACNKTNENIDTQTNIEHDIEDNGGDASGNDNGGESNDQGNDNETNEFVYSEIEKSEVNSFDEEYVNLYGRTYTKNGKLMLDHAATAIEFGIIGRELSVSIYCNNQIFICVYVDGEFLNRFRLSSGTNEYVLFDDIEDEYHKVRIVRSNEATDGEIGIVEISAAKFATVPEKSELKIEFIGDSIAVGYGIKGVNGQSRTVENSDATLAYAYTAASTLNADYSIVAVSGICIKAKMWQNITMNDIYKKISTSNAENYAFNFDPDVVVLNIGTNEATFLIEKDGSYSDIFPNDYYEFLTYLREKNPNAYIICIYGMMGADSRITNGIETAIGEMNDEKVVFYSDYTPDTSAVAYHPSARAQREWGITLAEYIAGIVS